MFLPYTKSIIKEGEIKMKSKKSFLAGSIGAGLAILSLSSQVFAGSQVDTYMNELRNEKMGQVMYQKLSEQYPSSQVYENLLRAETRHLQAMNRLTGKEDSSDIKIGDIGLPDSEMEALDFAIEFEEKDIRDLEEKLSTVENENDKKVLNRLLEASKRHKEVLEKGKEELKEEGSLENFSPGQVLGRMGRDDRRKREKNDSSNYCRENGQGKKRINKRNNQSSLDQDEVRETRNGYRERNSSDGNGQGAEK